MADSCRASDTVGDFVTSQVHGIRVVALTTGAARGARVVAEAFPVEGQNVSVGREGELLVGHDPADLGLSRTALVVGASDRHWRIEVSNRNGAVLRPWAQPATPMTFGSTYSLAWPRIAVRLIGKHPSLEHWVLLEADTLGPFEPRTEEVSPELATQLPDRPREVTLTQQVTVETMFADFFAWPPLSAPVARSMEAVAARHSVSPSAVRERLTPVAERAVKLGLPEYIGVTDPAYVFHLISRGFLMSPPPPFAESRCQTTDLNAR